MVRRARKPPTKAVAAKSAETKLNLRSKAAELLAIIIAWPFLQTPTATVPNTTPTTRHEQVITAMEFSVCHVNGRARCGRHSDHIHQTTRCADKCRKYAYCRHASGVNVSPPTSYSACGTICTAVPPRIGILTVGLRSPGSGATGCCSISSSWATRVTAQAELVHTRSHGLIHSARVNTQAGSACHPPLRMSTRKGRAPLTVSFLM